jgi:hypothetical protein
VSSHTRPHHQRRVEKPQVMVLRTAHDREVAYRLRILPSRTYPSDGLTRFEEAPKKRMGLYLGIATAAGY